MIVLVSIGLAGVITALDGARKTLLLSHEAIAVLEVVPERQRGAWVAEAIIERAARAALDGMLRAP